MTDLPERYLDDMDDRTQMDGEPIEKTELEEGDSCPTCGTGVMGYPHPECGDETLVCLECGWE